MLQNGEVIGERYRVLGELGAGSIGAVFEVEHIDLGTRHALKVLARPSEESAERLLREARLAATLDDPHLVRVSDFGRLGSRPYLVMERLVGTTLGARLRAGDLSPVGWIEAVIGVLRGLEAAHGAGVVHRDLKPDNVFLLDGGGPSAVKLLDLGLAKPSRPTDELRTAEGAVFGTPRYMAPEQAAGEPVDARSDLYAVGVMLFEGLSGAPPFTGRHATEVLRQHLVEPCPPMSFQGPVRGIDVAMVKSLVEQALAKDPTERPASATLMREVLEASLRAPGTLAAVRRSSLGVRVQTFEPKRSWLWGLAVLLPLALVGAGVVSTLERAPKLESVPPLGLPGDSEAPPPVGEAEMSAALEGLGAERLFAPDILTSSLSVGAHQLLESAARAMVAEGAEARIDALLGAYEQAPLPDAPAELASAPLVVFAREGASFGLRRRAFEALERFSRTEALGDVEAYLIRELRRNGTDVCTLRKWYVERLKDLPGEEVERVLRQERDRRTGFLDLEDKTGCMARLIDAALEQRRRP